MAGKDDFRMKNWVHFAGMAVGPILQRKERVVDGVEPEEWTLAELASDVAEFADHLLEQYMTRYEAEAGEGD